MPTVIERATVTTTKAAVTTQMRSTVTPHRAAGHLQMT